MNITVRQVDAIAEEAHRGQSDKGGTAYIEHPRAVARAVAFLGTETEMAALLHDVLEDTPVTADDLRALGVPEPVVRVVQVLTRPAGSVYQEWVGDVAGPLGRRDIAVFDGLAVSVAAAVKLADNGHNSMPSREVPGRGGMLRRYARARQTLVRALPDHVARRILGEFGVAMP